MLGLLPGGLFVVLLFASAMAAAERTITWEVLSPAMPDLRGPFRDLTDEQFAELYELYQLVQWHKSGQTASDSETTVQIDKMTAALKLQSVDPAILLRQLAERIGEYERIKDRPITEMDGLAVRLPGFVLPLEFGDTQTISEFFLVPYVGACIHTPPPAANQIVLVRLKQAYKFNGLYDPVWVTGRLKVVRNDRMLGYRDGVGRMASAYELEGMAIVPYR